MSDRQLTVQDLMTLYGAASRTIRGGDDIGFELAPGGQSIQVRALYYDEDIKLMEVSGGEVSDQPPNAVLLHATGGRSNPTVQFLTPANPLELLRG